MLLDSFPDPADDSGEPGDGLPPGGLEDEGPQQGLFLSVPAGHFDPDRFAQSGPAAEMPPDSLLATIMDTVTSPDGPGVGGLGDDQLIGSSLRGGGWNPAPRGMCWLRRRSSPPARKPNPTWRRSSPPMSWPVNCT